MKRCIHCGKEIADDSNYCVFCMSPLIEKKEVAGLVLPGRKKRAMLWLVISGILVLLGLAAVLTVTAVRKNGSDRSNPSGTRELAADGSRETEEENATEETTGTESEEEPGAESKEATETESKSSGTPVSPSEAMRPTETGMTAESVEQTSGQASGQTSEQPSEQATQSGVPAASTAETSTSSETSAGAESSESATNPSPALERFEIITFGPYEWYVLDWNETEVSLLSLKSVGEKRFDESGEYTWENSTLRRWLNGEFLNAFSASERDAILVKTVTTQNPYHNRTEITEEKVSLPVHKNIMVKDAPYSLKYALDFSFWFIRSISYGGELLCWVGYEKGEADSSTEVCPPEDSACVRPMIWVRREAIGK